MYKCAACQRQIAANIPSKLKTIVTRPKRYPLRRSAKGKVIDAGGEGYEIARQVRICPECYEKHMRADEKPEILH